MIDSVRVSVVVGTFNGSSFLDEQLHSIETQLSVLDEVVITDDCSTDDTVQRAEAFKERNSFKTTILLGSERLGVTRNFERGLATCTGDLIVLADQDDRWHEEKIGKLRAWAQHHPKTWLVVSNSDLCLADGRPTGLSVFQQAGHLRLPLRLVNQGSAMAFRRRLLEIALPFPVQEPSLSPVSHDVWLGALGDICGGRSLIHDSLQYYRRHEDTVSDWPVASTRRQFLLGRALKGVAVDPRPFLEERFRLLQMAAQRVQERFEENVLDGSMITQDAVTQELLAVQSRQALLAMPRRRRGPKAFSLLVTDSYRHFGSRWLAVKDLLV